VSGELVVEWLALRTVTLEVGVQIPTRQRLVLKFLLQQCLLANSAMMSTPTEHCWWGDEMERTGHPLS